MTKPADSGQIAKARERIKERLKAFSGKWLESHFIYDDFEFAADFAESERQAVIEECCRAVCKHCRDTTITKAHIIEGIWAHRVDSEHYVPCDAAAIRSMGE